MNFLRPTLLYLLFLIPLLLLLYILKLKRRTHIVSSCLLWEQVIEDMKANTLFQRLRRNLLLPLQVVILTLTVLALARPFLRGADDSARNIILVIDCSASMKATDVNGSRFESARSDAIKIVDNLRDGSRMTIISAGASPRIVSGPTSDKLLLKSALSRMQAKDTPSDLAGAIRLASSVAKDMRQSEILVMSDGAGNMEKEEHVEADVRFIGFGRKSASNVGITAIEVLAGQVFVAVQNFSGVRQMVPLELYHNEELIDVQELNLSPHERRPIVFDDVRYTKGNIKVVIDVNDDLDVDDRVFFLLREPSRFRILMVSSGNLFLESAIRTSNNKIELFIEPLEADEKLSGDYDLIVFDGFVADKLPESNLIFVNTRDDLPFGKLLSQKDNPAIMDWDRSHPIMRFVDLSGLEVDRVWNYEMPPWMKPIAESDTGGIIWAGEHNGQRIVVLPFEIRATRTNNFPLLPSFPIFISNVLSWLLPNTSRQVKSGDPIRLSFPQSFNGQVVTVRKPSGEEAKVRINNAGQLVFEDTDRVGIYKVIGKGIGEEFAVNLLDESESAVEHKDKIEIAGREIASSTPSAISNRELWAIGVISALMFLAIEWWVYHRRVLV